MRLCIFNASLKTKWREAVQQQFGRKHVNVHGAEMQNVGEEEYLGISFPCQTSRALTGVECAEQDRRHAHLVLMGDDGVAVVPVPLFSRPFLERLVVLMDWLTPTEREAIMGLEALASLSSEMTPREQEILSSDEEVKRLTNCVFQMN